MNVKIGESRQLQATSGTYNSLSFYLLLVHGTANTVIAQTDALLQNIYLKVMLNRNGKPYIICNDNLLVLGVESTLQRGYQQFLNGVDIVPASTGVIAQKMRSAVIDWKLPIRVNPGDTLTAELTFSTAALSANINTTSSFIDFTFNKCIGYEIGIPQIISKTVGLNATNDNYTPGDHVTKVAFLNLDKTDYQSQVITNVSLSSDRLDYNMTFNQLLASECLAYDNAPRMRWGTALPLTTTPTVQRGLDYLPQSFILFDGDKIQNELNDCNINMAFNASNVAASQNFLVYRNYSTDEKTLLAAQNRASKHLTENIKDVISKG